MSKERSYVSVKPLNWLLAYLLIFSALNIFKLNIAGANAMALEPVNNSTSDEEVNLEHVKGRYVDGLTAFQLGNYKDAMEVAFAGMHQLATVDDFSHREVLTIYPIKSEPYYNDFLKLYSLYSSAVRAYADDRKLNEASIEEILDDLEETYQLKLNIIPAKQIRRMVTDAKKLHKSETEKGISIGVAVGSGALALLSICGNIVQCIRSKENDAGYDPSGSFLRAVGLDNSVIALQPVGERRGASGGAARRARQRAAADVNNMGL